jgi:hypothetical protein
MTIIAISNGYLYLNKITQSHNITIKASSNEVTCSINISVKYIEADI